MKPFSRLFFQRFLTVSLLSAGTAAPALAQAPFDLKVHSGMGNETGNLQWSIADDPTGATGPNVLSELTYRDLQFSVFHASGELAFNHGALRNTVLFLDYQTGQATDGEVQDSDYNGNNRTREYSRSLSSAEESSLDGFTVGLGYRFRINQYNALTPMAAYTRQNQDLVMTQGQQVVDAYNPNNLGAFRGTLNSTYLTDWTGAWAGVRWNLETRAHTLALTLKNFWMDYHAEADWNLRNDFAHPKSFEHWATGGGTGVDLSYQYRLSNNFSLRADWYQQNWETGTGQDTVYFANGTTGGSQLNEVSWESTGFSMGIQLEI
ncbi:MAG TPA: hypothetical protein VFX11_04065 [Candidatus Kapabacteria bacterium]|nr:hypothetical protein [Candidatus Kapabacteria bacterium]